MTSTPNPGKGQGLEGGLTRLAISRAAIWRHSLVYRILVGVALGSGLILTALTVLTLVTVYASVEDDYDEHVLNTEILARHTDDVILRIRDRLERLGTELRGPSNGATPDTPHAALERAWTRMPGLTGMAWIAGGHEVGWAAGTAPAVIDTPELRALATRVRSSAAPAISSYQIASGQARRAVALGIPVNLAAGRNMAVLIGMLDPRSPDLALVPSWRADDLMQTQLVDSQGQILVGAPPIDERSVAEHVTLLRRLMDTHTAGFAIHHPTTGGDVGAHLVAYAPLSAVPGFGIVVEQPSDAIAPVPRRLTFVLGGFGIAALILSVAAAWAHVRRVVRPLHRLSAAAAEFAAGDLGRQVRLNRGDELGVLADALETMRRQLYDSLTAIESWNRELERRVAVRTQEVEVRSQQLAQLNARLRTREQERAVLLQQIMVGQEEERRRLAQELHDDASQALTTLRLGLERLAAGTEAPVEARRLAEELQQVTAHTLAEVHRMAVELRPSVLDDVGLVAAIARCAEDLAERGELEVDFLPVHTDGLRLLPAAEMATYRIVQAALNNIAQHAHARRVSVVVERRSDTLAIVLEDDGLGFDLDAVQALPLEQRLGLAGMQERAELIGARLTIETSPWTGTVIFLSVPLEINRIRTEGVADAARSAG